LFSSIANTMALKEALAPGQQEMSCVDIKVALDKYDSVLVNQTMRGCVQECLGCEAKSEFKLSNLDGAYVDGGWVSEAKSVHPAEMYAVEQSGCCVRFWCRDGRPFVMTVSQGGDAGGAPIVQYKKPFGCPVYIGQGVPCCCFLPELTTILPDGTEHSKSKYLCSICVPKLSYQEPPGEDLYILHPPTCCGGICIQPQCGRRCCSIPFYFFDPTTGKQVYANENIDKSAQIRQVRNGLKKECFSSATSFAIKFPEDADAKRKAGILGLTFLLDFTLFERQQDK
jgi:hypothetical protein